MISNEGPVSDLARTAFLSRRNEEKQQSALHQDCAVPGMRPVTGPHNLAGGCGTCNAACSVHMTSLSPKCENFAQKPSTACSLVISIVPMLVPSF